jgi:hypothetical protein
MKGMVMLSRDEIEAIKRSALESASFSSDEDTYGRYVKAYHQDIAALCDLAISAQDHHAAGVAEGLAMAAKVCDELLRDEVMSKHVNVQACKDARRGIEKCAKAIRALPQQDTVSVPTLICPLCEADRYKEPCRGRDILKCPMTGTAAAKGEPA